MQSSLTESFKLNPNIIKEIKIAIDLCMALIKKEKDISLIYEQARSKLNRLEAEIGTFELNAAQASDFSDILKKNSAANRRHKAKFTLI